MMFIKNLSPLLLLLFITSCNQIVSSNKIETGCIKIGIGSNASLSISNPNASMVSNRYLFIVTDGTHLYKEESDGKSDVALSIPIGDSYKIIVLAGYCNGGSFTCLLGSGSASNISVVTGETTYVNVVLNAIISDFIVPVEAVASSEIAFSLSGNTGVPEVFPYLVYTSTGSHFSIEGSIFNISKNVTVPSTIGNYYITIQSSESIKLKYGSIDTLLNNINAGLSKSWVWPNFTQLQGTIFESEVKKEIEIVNNLSGVNIGVTWGE